MRLEVEPVRLRFRDSVRTAYGRLEGRTLLAVRLRARDGLTGVGEAAPLEPYDGVSLEAVREEIESCRHVLADAGDRAGRADLLDACGELCRLPQSLAAIDLALWDLEGKRAHLPVAALLVRTPAPEVAVNALVGAVDPGQAVRDAASAVASGHRCLKVKVGAGDDLHRAAAVRAAVGHDVALRLDANGAWSVDEAVEALRGLATARPELCEEPVHGVEALREVRDRIEGRVAIAMDETAAEPGAIGAGAVDAVCLKVARCGGITGVLEAARVARAAGSEVYLASTFDGPAGIAAALHAAAALRVRRACGLATLALFADSPDPFPVRRGAIALPSGPGLGVP